MDRHPLSARQPSSSLPAVANNFPYSRSSRPIPSPDNILSIDRLDEDGGDGDDEDVGAPHAAKTPLQRPTNNSRTSMRMVSRAGEGKQSSSPRGDAKAEKEQTDDELLYCGPNWTRQGERHHEVGSSPHPSRIEEKIATSIASTATEKSTTRTKGNARAFPSAKHETIFDISPIALSTSPHHDHKGGVLSESLLHHNGDSTRHLRHLLRRYQRYVEGELEPQLEHLKKELQERNEECTRLHSDNVILAQRLQRLQSASVARPSGPPLTVPHTPEVLRASNREDQRLHETSAEVTLLKRQLAHVQGQYDRLARSMNGGTAIPSAQPVSSLFPMLSTVTLTGSDEEAARTELANVCRALSEDGLGFTEALSELHERLNSGKRGGNNDKDGTRNSNPFKYAAEEWRRFARLTASSLTSTNNNARSSADNHLSTTSNFLTACTGAVKLLAETLLVEHGAVAAGIEAAQHAGKYSLESVARYQKLVEQVRREAERRIEELEVDHETEVQTLENTIAELEQQLSMAAASRRPWTAGLLKHRSLGPTSVSYSSNSNARSSLEVSAARRESAAPSGGTSDSFDNARRAADTRVGAPLDRTEGETQTPLSLEWIQACLQKAREEPMRAARREKEAELVELMLADIETLRQQLTDSRAVVMRLREEQRRFLGDVTLPLSYFDNFSSFPAYV